MGFADFPLVDVKLVQTSHSDNVHVRMPGAVQRFLAEIHHVDIVWRRRRYGFASLAALWTILQGFN